MTEQEKILRYIDGLRADAAPFCVATVVRTAAATSAKAGAKAVVTADGELRGYVGGGCVTGAVKRAALACLNSGEPRMIRVKPSADIEADDVTDADGAELHPSGCPSGGTVDLFLEPTLSAPRLVICGASPVAAALLQLAGSVGMATVAAAESGDHVALPGAGQYLAGFALETLQLSPRDAVAVVTQGKHDRPALLAALRSPAGYVGMVGSRKKVAFLRDQIAAELSAERLSALRGPAGLDIGAIGPEEIALSVVAEIVAQRRDRTPSE